VISDLEMILMSKRLSTCLHTIHVDQREAAEAHDPDRASTLFETRMLSLNLTAWQDDCTGLAAPNDER
jgi:hypothetical protein